MIKFNQTNTHGPGTPITYYGGKQKMVKNILPLIPEHNLYCEPFLGGGAVFWAKPQSNVEVINDTDDRVVNFYKTTQTDYGILRMLVKATPHSRAVHREAEAILKNPDCFSEIKRAWAFWVQTNTGFAGQMFSGWGYEVKTNKFSRKVTGKADKFLKVYQQRLSSVQIECNDAIKVIKSRDRVDSFFYCDPPYYNSNMGHYGGYSLENFKDLLDTLAGLKGKFILSSYPSDILLEYASSNGWYKKEFTSKIAVSHLVNRSKTEVLTANFPI